MRLKPPRFLKSNSGSSIIQATIAAGVAFIVLYAMTSSMLNLNKQSNIVNLKLEVSNMANQLDNLFSKRSQCTANMLKNGIILVAPGTPKLTFNAAVAANSAPLAFYDDAAGTTKISNVIPGPTGGKLNYEFVNADATTHSARILSTVADPILPVPGIPDQYTASIEVRYNHGYAGLLGVFKPVVITGVTMDVNPATGAVTGCQLSPKVRTIGCDITYPNSGAGAINRTFFTGAAAPATDACDSPAPGANYEIRCKSPAYTLGGCSSANTKMIGASITNVTIMANGCSIPVAGATTQTKLFITCIGNN